jgi:hypothetical protein
LKREVILPMPVKKAKKRTVKKAAKKRTVKKRK